MLPARIGIVGDVEVPFLQGVDRVRRRAGAEDLRHRPQLHGNELGLRDDVAVAVEQGGRGIGGFTDDRRSEEHTSELQSLMRISYAVFCLKNKKPLLLDKKTNNTHRNTTI